MTRALNNFPGVYCIRNKVDGKRYVGSSIDVARRLKQHAAYLRKGTHHIPYLQNAWDKYGETNFEFFLLERTSEEECIKREQHYLDEWQTYKFENGYNQSPYAECSSYNKSEEGRQKSREVMLRNHQDPEFARRIAAAGGAATSKIMQEQGPTEKQRAARRKNGRKSITQHNLEVKLGCISSGRRAIASRNVKRG